MFEDFQRNNKTCKKIHQDNSKNVFIGETKTSLRDLYSSFASTFSSFSHFIPLYLFIPCVFVCLSSKPISLLLSFSLSFCFPFIRKTKNFNLLLAFLVLRFPLEFYFLRIVSCFLPSSFNFLFPVSGKFQCFFYLEGPVISNLVKL